MADIRINALATTATTPASDDYLALDGTAQGTRKILATNIANNVTDVILGTSGPSVKSTLSARAPRQGLVFDGTAGATVSGPTLGTSNFTAAAWVNISSLPASAISGIISGAANSLSFGIGTTGAIDISKTAVANVGTSTGTITAGKQSFIVYSRSGTTGTFYINGVASGTVTDSQDYSVAQTLVGSAVTSSLYVFPGTIVPLIYNRALSASEVVALYEAGAPSGADYNSASSTNLATSTVTGNGTITGASATGFTLTAAAVAFKYATANPGFAITAGTRYRVSFNYTRNSGTATNYVNLITAAFANASTTPSIAISAGDNTVEFTASVTDAGAKVLFGNTNGAADDYTISGISITRLGLLLAPDAAQAGNGYVWNDQSGNLAQIVLPSSGVQWNLPSVAGQRIRGTTSTNGNQQLLGASVLLPAECQITHVRARARSGTPTITIGTASGGAQIVASVALSTTWLNCTIALTGGIVSSADDIWIGSNSTDVVETDIAFQPLDF